MPRSLSLVAAAVWLLELGACAQEAPARPPPVLEAPRAVEASRVTLSGGRPGKAAPALAPAAQLPVSPASPAMSASGGRSHEQLRARFAQVRPLSVQHGSASYYAEKFAGRSTASGAPYEPRGFTAAHRSLPFGTVLRVTRLDGGQVVYVRVTDRGPFGPRGRILDLSRAAAEQLHMLRAGVVKIKAEVMEYGPPRKKRKRRR